MALTSQISEYNDRWPHMFESEKTRLENVFGSPTIEIHHVGSTAVPGLAAKPEIDLLVVLADQENEAEVDRAIASLGYIRGKNLSNGHHFYRRDAASIRTHKVHVCQTGHWQISRMLRFRDMLRRDQELRQRYQDLKLELEATNEHGIKEYLARKAPFIDAVVGPQPKIE